jgi:sulfate permease, SulP family
MEPVKEFASKTVPVDELSHVEPRSLRADLAAGLTFAIVNVPQAMGHALLATVNPVYGLYTLMIATPVGALLTSSVYMNVSTTSALSATLGSALATIQGAPVESVLVTLVLLAGAFQLVLGLFRMGWLVRFIPNSVMIGFLNGVAVLIILGQLGDLTGYKTSGANKVAQTVDLLTHVQQIDVPSLATGLLTILVIAVALRTRFSRMALVLGLLATTALVALLQPESVRLVQDIATLPTTLPRPSVPDITLLPQVVTAAVSLAIVGLVLGAGVSQAYVNPDGKYPDSSRDFLGQGAANVATSFFGGIPAGGSVSGTGLAVSAGATTRWANIFAGLCVAVLILVFRPLISLVPMPALAGLLVVIGVQSLRIDDARTVWQTGHLTGAAMGLTFVGTLLVPLQYAVFTGVAVAVMVNLFQDANQVKIVEVIPVPGGFPIEEHVPAQLPSDKVTGLLIYGSTAFAAAGTLEASLPALDNTQHAVAILGLRGRAEIGSTFLSVLRRYAEELRARDSRLMLVGVDPVVMDQLRRTGTLAALGKENVFPWDKQFGGPMNRAIEAANAWLTETAGPPDDIAGRT